MKISIGSSTLPTIIEDEDGVDVLCEAVSDRALLRLLDGTADAFVFPLHSDQLSSAGEDLLDTLKAYYTGALEPEPCSDASGDPDEDHDRRLAPVRAALEQERRWLVVGRAQRQGAHGIESVAVVAVAREPLAACLVRLRPRDESRAETPRAA